MCRYFLTIRVAIVATYVTCVDSDFLLPWKMSWLNLFLITFGANIGRLFSLKMAKELLIPFSLFS